MKYLKIYVFTLSENWERNNNSADMQPYVALFIPTSCNSLESWEEFLSSTHSDALLK